MTIPRNEMMSDFLTIYLVHNCKNDWLIDILNVSFKIFHSQRDVTITGEGLQNLRLGSTFLAFVQECLYIVPYNVLCITRDLGSHCLIRRTASLSRLVRHVQARDTNDPVYPGIVKIMHTYFFFLKNPFINLELFSVTWL